jgi:imidazole glycerol-phosphate synthase subunit HisH
MIVAIVDYGAGNLRSAEKALAKAADEANARVIVTADPDAVRKADKIVLPGVGAFAECRNGLGSLPGMIDTLEEQVLVRGKPFLGICVGMQLMADVGIEFGETKGLGWIKGRVVVLDPADRSLRIPQMGWNDLKLKNPGHPVLQATRAGDHAYFVHSYHFVAERREDVMAEVEYGGPVAAMIGRDNLVGVQFHPEKSQQVGLNLLSAFLAWRP